MKKYLIVKDKYLFFCLILSFIFFLSSRSLAYEDSKEKRINLWPLVVYSKSKNENIERIEILGPFIQKYRFKDEKGFSLRPIYSSVEEKEEKRAFFLSPLGLYKSDNETSTFKLIPLINQKVEKEATEEKEGKKWEYFPIFWGRTANNETYGGFFPFYGKYKDRFGREEITFILWPIYSKVEYQEHKAYNILWPFFRISKAKDPENKEYGGYKFWPFYGHFKEGEEERKFILWPFYIRQTYKDDAGNFEEKVLYFPFYGREKTDAYEKSFYFWPFFQKVCASDPFYEQIDAPWPFYRKIRGEEISGKRIWPFYGYVKKKETYDSFILWPLYFYKEDNYKKGNFTYFEKEHRFLLLSKENQVFENGTLTHREFRFWPFYYSSESKEKNLKIHYLPALIPFYDEGVERNYGPLFRIFENYEKEDYQFVKILWGLYRFEKKGNRKVHELAFIVRTVQDDKTNYFEILEGFFGAGKIGDQPVIKVLYINFWLKKITDAH